MAYGVTKMSAEGARFEDEKVMYLRRPPMKEVESGK